MSRRRGDYYRPLMPEATDATLELVPRRSVSSIVLGLVIAPTILALVVTGIVFLILHFTKSKEGTAGNWTEAQIADKTEAFMANVPPMLSKFFSREDLRRAADCSVREVARVYAYNDDCFKSASCAKSIDAVRVMNKCLGGEKGNWSGGIRDVMAAIIKGAVPDLKPAEVTCAVDALARSYSFSEIAEKFQTDMSTGSNVEFLLNLARSCGGL